MLRNPHLPAGTILVGSFSSHCNNCGKDTSPHEKTHAKVIGYVPGEGCGVEFTHVASEYMGQEETVKAMRPDLEYVDYLPRPF
jgi:hypothetical protein